MEFPRFQWWGLPLWGSKEKERENGHDGSSLSCLFDSGYGFREQPETVKFPLKEGRGRSRAGTGSRKGKKKWLSREDRKIDREHDVVVVPSDGVCLSGSESDDSDWSIGWLEPHGADFLSDDETDDSFAVLVPCYRNDRRRGSGSADGPSSQLLNAIKTLTNEHFTEEKNFMEQWLSSLQNF